MKLVEKVINQIEALHNGDTSEGNLAKLFNKEVAIKGDGQKVIKYNMLELAQLSDKFIVDYDMVREPEMFVNDMLLNAVLNHYA